MVGVLQPSSEINLHDLMELAHKEKGRLQE